MEYEAYISIAKAFAQLSYQGVYLIDTTKDRFLYHSDSMLLWHNLTEEEWLKPTSHILRHTIPTDDIHIIDSITDAIRTSYASIPLEYRERLVITFNFHIKESNQTIAVNHKLSMLNLDDNGEPRLLLGLVSPPVHSDDPTIIAGIRGTNLYYLFDLESKRWIEIHAPILTPNELTMLRLSWQGYTMENISQIMCKSLDTIRFYRRQVFKKFEVENITEAIAFAVHYGVL